VPFYLRTGKRLPQQASEISIQFRAVPHRSFPPEASLGWQPSRLVLSIQPDEGIVLGFQAKYPGPKMQLRPVDTAAIARATIAVPPKITLKSNPAHVCNGPTPNAAMT